MRIFNIIFLITLVGLLLSCGENKKSTKVETTTSADSITSIASSEDTKADDKKEVVDTGTPLPTPDLTSLNLVSHTIMLPSDTFELNIPEGYVIKIAFSGLKRIRFMDKSPDGRIFLTDMQNLADNKIGKVYVLDGLNDSTGTFSKINTYLDKLRNPNSIAFYTDNEGKHWLYLALTDKLVRYVYEEGSIKPSAPAEVLDIYPDYGLSYRYGGWHLTRTIQFGTNGKMYISIGSSCNACVEKEESRACIVEMDPDGKNRRIYAKGIRNAVGLEFVNGGLYATNMAADHFGNDKPEDALYKIIDGANYGWPFCYQSENKMYSDPKFDTVKVKPVKCENAPLAYSYFGAHAAPLGVEWFDASTHSDAALTNYFLVAMHGSYTPKIGRGYSIQRIRKDAPPEDFISGFMEGDVIHGRPCGIFSLGADSFLFTDDKMGVLYYVYKKH